MTFGNPIGLLGFLAIPVIFLLHLLRQRQRRIVVSNINLWSFLEEEVRGPQPQRIPITWILILDLLIGCLFTLAWSQPLISLPIRARDAQQYIILIDTSASMQARTPSLSRFDQAVMDATTLINGLHNQDIATIITFGENPTLIADTRQVDIQETLSRLLSIKAVEIGHAIDAAFITGLSTIDGNLPVEFHVFTDAAFPLDRSDLTDAWKNLAYTIHWHFYTGETDNQAVVSVEVQDIDDTDIEVFTKVANFGSQSSTRFLILLSDGKPVDSFEVLIPAKSTITHVWRLNKPAAVYTVALSGSDQYQLDDRFITATTPPKIIHVVYVTDNPSPINTAINAIPGTELTVISPKEYSPSLSSDLTIFRNSLPSSWPGNTVLIIDPPEAIGNYEAILPPRQKMPIEIKSKDYPQILNPDPILTGINFDSVRWVKVWSLSEIPHEFSKLVQISDVPILLRGTGNGSDIIVLLADLNSGNFTNDPAFIVLLANIVGSIQQGTIPERVQLNQPIPFPAVGDYQLLRITPPGSKAVEYLQSWPSSWDDTSVPGEYLIELQDASGNMTKYPVGVNAADAVESDLYPKSWINNLGQTLSSDVSEPSKIDEQQINLAPYLLIAGILILLLETLKAWR